MLLYINEYHAQTLFKNCVFSQTHNLTHSVRLVYKHLGIYDQGQGLLRNPAVRKQLFK